MWLIVSSSTQHKKHLLPKFHPLLLSWSRVRTFPHEASQAKKTHLSRNTRAPNDAPRKRKKSHSLSLSTPPCPPNQQLVSFLKESKGALSTASTSQSLKDLEKQGFHPPSPPPFSKESQQSTTHASLETTKSNKEGKESWRVLFPHHLPFQNLTLLPSPTEKVIFFKPQGTFLTNFLPKPHPIALPYFTSTPPSSFLPKLPTNNKLPQGLPFNRITPTPLT